MMLPRIRILKKILILVICLTVLVCFGNDITVSSGSNSPALLMYELRLIDIKAEKLSAFGIDEFSTGGSEIDISFLDSSIVEVSLPGISITADARNNENVFRSDFNPKIMTIPGEPAFVSITRQIISATIAPSLESFIFVFNPISYNPEAGFMTEIGVSKTGDSSMQLITSVKHNENEWFPIAIMNFSGEIGYTSIFTSGEDKLQRYSVVYMRTRVVTSTFPGEELEESENTFIWMDFEGLEKLFSKEGLKTPKHSSFIGGEVKFEESLEEYLIALEGQIYFPDTAFVDSEITIDSTYSISKFKTITGLLLYDSFSFIAELKYIAQDPFSENFSIGFGFDDITNPIENIFLRAGFVPVRVYPAREQDEILVEYPLEWYLEVFSDKKNDWNFGIGLAGAGNFSYLSAELGYKFEYMEIIGGLKFNFEKNALNPYFKLMFIF